MKTILTFFCSLCCCIFAISQDSIAQQYINLVKATPDPAQRIVHLDSLLANANSLSDEQLLLYQQQFIQDALYLKSYEKATQGALKASNVLSQKLNRSADAVKLLDSLAALEGVQQHKSSLANLYFKKGQINMNHQGYESAIDAYNLALETFPKEDSLTYADALNYRGRCYSNTGQFIKAIDDYNLAYEYYKNLGDTEFMLNAKQGIIIVYGMNGFYEKAEEERKKYIEGSKEHKFYGNIVLESSNQAFDYQKQGAYDKAINSLLLSEKFLDSMQDDYFKGYIFSRIASTYADVNDISKTKEYLDKVKTVNPYFSNKTFKMVNANAQSKYEKLLKNYPKAIQLAEERLVLAKSLGYEEQIAFSKELLAELHELNGNDPLALKFYKESASLKDSLYNSKSKNALSYYQTLYETERKERLITEKNGEIELLEQENTYKTRLLLFGGLAAGLLLLTLFVNRNRQIIQKKRELQVQYSQDLLKQQEEERKRVSKELHDGIGQSLLLIKNKVALKKDDSTAALLNEAIEEVRSISRDLHPFQLKELGLTKSIQTVAEKADESTEIFISHEIEDVDGLFTQVKEVSIFRMVQESISNIIKHAEAQAARIEISKHGGHILLIIKDNGKGFDFSEKYNDFKSLGLKTLKERTRLLGGIMKVLSTKGEGTTLEFNIPIS